MAETALTALVTGASRGIGRAAAIHLASLGYTVGINYAGHKEEAESVCREIERQGGAAVLMQGDVSCSGDVARIYQSVKEQWGHIDVLVNNAGITRDALLIRMKEEDWNTVIRTNLTGAFLMLQGASVLMMKQRHGCIVNITSVVGLTGNVGQVNYAAAKAGLIGMTKTAAKELAGRGIRVNAVAPGFIQTSMTQAIPDKIREGMISSIPMKHMGTPENVADAVCFLVSEQASYITGQVLQVDGGMVM